MGPFRTSAGATLYVALLAVSPGEARIWLSSSNAGSGLPWWSPIAVTVLLLVISLVYRFRHRPAPPTETSQLLDGTVLPPGAQSGGNDNQESFFWRRFVIGEHRKPRQV